MNKLTKEVALEMFRSSQFNPTDIQIVHTETGLHFHVQSVEDWNVTMSCETSYNLKWDGRWEKIGEHFHYYFRKDVKLKICPICGKKVSVNDYIDIQDEYEALLHCISSGELKNPTQYEEMLWEARVHNKCYPAYRRLVIRTQNLPSSYYI